MYTETSSGEILMIVVSWFLCQKKNHPERNLPRVRKETCMIIYRNLLWWNSYDCLILVSMKEKKPHG